MPEAVPKVTEPRNTARSGFASGLATVRRSVERHRRRSAVLAFLRVVLLGGAVLGAVYAVASTRIDFGNVRIVAWAGFGSLLAAFVSVLAAFVTYRMKLQDDARIAAEQRVADLRGVAVALHAEITDNAKDARGMYNAESLVEIWLKMEHDPAYLPLLSPDDGGSEVYSAVIDKLVHFANYCHPVVPAVVGYYAADKVINQSITSLYSQEFRALCNPADPRSVRTGRPRQMRLVIWTLLSVSDTYEIKFEDSKPGTPARSALDLNYIEEAGGPELAHLVRRHLEDREDRARRNAMPFVPFAEVALRALEEFEADAYKALRFLQHEIARG